MTHRARLAIAPLVVVVSALLLSACAGGISNPFSRGNADVDETPVDDNRISLVSAEATLNLSSTLGGQSVPLPEPVLLSSWPNEGGNATKVVGHVALSPQVSRIWTRNIGKGSSRTSRVSTPPIVADGFIFALDGAGQVSALDEYSGERVWSRKLRSESKRDRETRGGGLAYAEGRLFATSGYGYITAMDPATGAEIWRRDTGAPLHSSPTFHQGRLYVVSVDNELFAVDAAIGEIDWTYRSLNESARILSSSSPAVSGDVVIAPFASGEVVALRAQNGRPLWAGALSRTTTGTALSSLNDIAGSPVFADDVVFAASQSGVLNAFDAVTGETLWSQPAGGINMPWVTDTAVFTISADGQLAALDRNTGEAYWIVELPRFAKPKARKGRMAWRGPVLAGDRLIMVSSRGDYWEVSPRDGSILRQERSRNEYFVPPVVANNSVYILSDDAKLSAWR